MRGSFSQEVQRINQSEETKYRLGKLRLALESATASLQEAEFHARFTKGGEYVAGILSARPLVEQAFKLVREKLGEDTKP